MIYLKTKDIIEKPHWSLLFWDYTPAIDFGVGLLFLVWW